MPHRNWSTVFYQILSDYHSTGPQDYQISESIFLSSYNYFLRLIWIWRHLNLSILELYCLFLMECELAPLPFNAIEGLTTNLLSMSLNISSQTQLLCKHQQMIHQRVWDLFLQRCLQWVDNFFFRCEEVVWFDYFFVN